MTSFQEFVLDRALIIGLKHRTNLLSIMREDSFKKKDFSLEGLQEVSFKQLSNSLRKKDGKTTRPKELFASLVTAFEITLPNSSARNGASKISLFLMKNSKKKDMFSLEFP